MNNMMLNDSVENVAANEAKIAINGRYSTLSETPRIFFVMRDFRVGVM